MGLSMNAHETVRAERRWQEIYRKAALGISINRVLNHTAWVNPSVRLLFDQIQQKASRQVWFPFGRETMLHLMESQRKRALENMDLGFDVSQLFSPVPRNILRGWQ